MSHVTIEQASYFVQVARQNPETWCGNGHHDDEVIFANGVYSVGSNGETEDFRTPAAAAKALRRMWTDQDEADAERFAALS